jgi:GT2 family glycosyltransferase
LISYLLPTHNRPRVLWQTLAALGALPCDDHAQVGGAEIVVVDNASRPAVELPSHLDNDLPVRCVRLDENHGAAARNHGAAAARGEWLVMLDDDSYPLDTGHLQVLAEAPADVAAIGAEIVLPDGTREAGGLPEVIVGCGAAIRRDAFLDVGGYDPDFHYYAEEYDLCAKLLLAGLRIRHDLRFHVRHGKVPDRRDMNVILHNLVRNNGWVMQRYAPRHRREQAICEVIARYVTIAMKEGAAWGYAQGMCELKRTQDDQVSKPMSEALFDRFTGLAHARTELSRCPQLAGRGRVAIVDEGKHADAVRQTLREIGTRFAARTEDADVLVIGTLSPGPMLDARDSRRVGPRPVLMPWCPDGICEPAPGILGPPPVLREAI